MKLSPILPNYWRTLSAHNHANTKMDAAYNTNMNHIWRRGLLLSGILLSGGALYLPKIVLTVLFTIFSVILLKKDRLEASRKYQKIYYFTIVILFLAGTRFSEHEAISTLTKTSYFLMGLILLIVYQKYNNDVFIKDLVWLIYPMTYQAIFTVILAAIAPSLFIEINHEDLSIRTFFLLLNYHVLLDESSLLIRPDGFFWEPGVLQMYLNIFIYVNLFRFNNLKQAALGALAVIATASTTGIFAMFFILLSFFYKKFLRDNKNRLKLIFVMIIIAPIITIVTYDNLNDKIFGAGQGSTLTRQFDLITGINIAVAHPILGIGFSKENYIGAASLYGFEDSELGEEFFRERPGTTNGIVQIIYSIGFPLALFIIISLFNQKLVPERIVFGTTLVIFMLGENLILTPFFLMFVFAGMISNSNSRDPRGSKPIFNEDRPLEGTRKHV